MKRVAYSNFAVKTLRRMPANESARVEMKIEEYATNPASQANNVKKLTGRPGFRLRVGNWRVLFKETDDIIDVVTIGPRGSVYR